jgi:hypothetical protein
LKPRWEITRRGHHRNSRKFPAELGSICTPARLAFPDVFG